MGADYFQLTEGAIECHIQTGWRQLACIEQAGYSPLPFLCHSCKLKKGCHTMSRAASHAQRLFSTPCAKPSRLLGPLSCEWLLDASTSAEPRWSNVRSSVSSLAASAPFPQPRWSQRFYLDHQDKVPWRHSRACHLKDVATQVVHRATGCRPSLELQSQQTTTDAPLECDQGPSQPQQTATAHGT